MDEARACNVLELGRGLRVALKTLLDRNAVRRGCDVDFHVAARGGKGTSVFQDIKKLQVWTTLSLVTSKQGPWFGLQVILVCKSKRHKGEECPSVKRSGPTAEGADRGDGGDTFSCSGDGWYI